MHGNFHNYDLNLRVKHVLYLLPKHTYSLGGLIPCVTLTGHRIYRLSSISVSVRVFPDGISIEAVDSVKYIALPSVGGHRPISKDWVEQNAEEGEFALFFLPPWSAGTSHFLSPCPWTGIYTISSPGFQGFALGLGLNYTRGFPRCPACRWVGHGTSQPQYYMSQFLIINLLCYLSISLSIYLATYLPTHLHPTGFVL